MVANIPRYSRDEILHSLHRQIATGKPLVGAGAGTGLSAKCAQNGGADLIVIYNSGRFRMAGRGSLAGMMPYGDANAIVLEMAKEVLPIATETPVLAGVCGTDPFRIMSIFLNTLKSLGFVGVQNFPTVGLIDGIFRKNLEETGMGYDLEVEMISEAHKLDLLTTPYVFTPEEAQAMTRAGADVLVAHMGLTTKGAIGAQTAKNLEESIDLIQQISYAGKSVREDVLVICHGGPLSEPADVAYALAKTRGVVGFFGASSMERLPTETAIQERVESFKTISLERVE